MDVVTLTIAALVGVISVGDSVVAGLATGTVASVNGSTLVVNVTAGTFAPGAMTDTTSGATATITTSVPSTAGTVAVVSGNIIGFDVTSGAILSGVTVTDTSSAATAVVSGDPLLVTAFPGRAVIMYVVRDSYSRAVDVGGEYSLVGDSWLPMTQGGGDSGTKAVASSTAGELHSFYWDAFVDLDGTYDNIWMRILPRVSVATIQTNPDPFVAVVQEGYTLPPINRSTSEQIIKITGPLGPGNPFTAGETVSASSGTGGLVQFADDDYLTLTAVTGPGFVANPLTEAVTGSIPGHSGWVDNAPSIYTNVITLETLPADETANLEEYFKATAAATNPATARVYTQYVFQGRLSSTQTRIRSLRFTLSGNAVGGLARVSVYVSGQGPINQYLSGRQFSSFQSLPLAEQEIIISNVDLSNQPSLLGKRYSVVVECDLGPSESMTVSTPYFRHE
jgi:hypothetical protein